MYNDARNKKKWLFGSHFQKRICYGIFISKSALLTINFWIVESACKSLCVTGLGGQ